MSNKLRALESWEPVDYADSYIVSMTLVQPSCVILRLVDYLGRLEITFNEVTALRVNLRRTWRRAELDAGPPELISLPSGHKRITYYGRDLDGATWVPLMEMDFLSASSKRLEGQTKTPRFLDVPTKGQDDVDDWW